MTFPDCAFWDFSLALYARPGVAPACLRLQARRGADVNLLLYCLWLGAEKARRLSRAEIDALRAQVRTIHDDVVRPLRQARTALKEMREATPFDTIVGTLRAAVKRHELDAEHLEQLLLAEIGTKVLIPGSPDSQPVAAAQANAEAYLAGLASHAPDADDRADIAALVAFLDKK